eukprot:scaffold1171_cov177-Amphora_coffeaeformis.AAC.4
MSSSDNRTIPMEVDATVSNEPATHEAASFGDAASFERITSSRSLPVSTGKVDMINTTSASEVPVDSTSRNEETRPYDMINQASMPASFPAMSDLQPRMSVLGKGWGDYMSDAKGMQFDSFKRFFGNESTSSDSMSELKDMILGHQDGRFYTPLALRHTHSTPLQKPRSILDEYAMRSGLPPPIPLDPFQRSSSTPSAFRTRSVNSAFGSVRTSSPANDEETCSLVGVQYVSMNGEPAVSYRCSAFDPVQYYARQLEDMAVQEDMERTSIEVTDTMTSLAADNGTSPKNSSKRRPKRGAAVAERFLANVRGLRRRRRGRSARDETASQGMATDGEDDDDDQSIMSVPPQTTVTVITEPGSVTTGCSRSSELSAILKHSSSISSSRLGLTARPSDQEEPLRPAAPTYHHLDSDAEEDAHYQKIEASLQAESPQSVPSPTYQPMLEDRIQESVQGDRIRIQVSGKRTPPVTTFEAKENTSPLVFNSPSVNRVARSLDSALTHRSNDSMTDSPQTNRSSNTGSSMGHTTQATSCSSIQQSNLSTISETDREVMLANKEGKRRRGLDRLKMHAKQGLNTSTESVNSSSTNSNSTSTNPHGYLALQGSPAPRDGANVGLDGFFMNGGGSQAIPSTTVHSLGNSSSSRRSGRSGSPVTDGSSAMTHTSSSSSSRTEPPTFVSYLDRKNASDLTTTREEMETCESRSGRVDNEEREGSPAPIVGYEPMYFEEAGIPAEQQAPKPVRPPSRPDKFRSRPPRSPMKGSRMITTPPPCRTSPLYQQLSPPRQIVDHPHQNISQPYVLRTTLSGKNLVFVGELGTNGHNDDGGLEVMHGVTYEENPIEIMKSNSKDEMMP